MSFAFGISVDQGRSSIYIQYIADFPLNTGIQTAVIHRAAVLILNGIGIDIVREDGITHPVIVNADLKSPVVREGTIRVKSTRARVPA